MYDNTLLRGKGLVRLVFVVLWFEVLKLLTVHTKYFFMPTLQNYTKNTHAQLHIMSPTSAYACDD